MKTVPQEINVHGCDEDETGDQKLFYCDSCGLKVITKAQLDIHIIHIIHAINKHNGSHNKHKEKDLTLDREVDTLPTYVVLYCAGSTKH